MRRPSSESMALTPQLDAKFILLEAEALLVEFEGLRLKAYQDFVGVWTIGYGYTKGVKEGDEITKAQAKELLWSEMKLVLTQVQRVVTAPVNNLQMAALVSFTYNLGIGNLTKSTLLKKLNAGAPKAEVAEEFKRWNKAKGIVLPGLTRRRSAESELFLS